MLKNDISFIHITSFTDNIKGRQNIKYNEECMSTVINQSSYCAHNVSPIMGNIQS